MAEPLGKQTHVYNHYDAVTPTVSIEVNQTTRGVTWTVKVSQANSPAQALELFDKANAGLAERLPKQEDAK